MNQCHFGDVRDVLRRMIDEGVRVNCIVTSPPYYGLRDYGTEGQIGLEATPEEYVATMAEVFRLARDLLADDGVLWLNLGDSYARAVEKGGSGPNGKNGYGEGYTEAVLSRARAGVALASNISKQGTSDGAVGRAERPGTRAIGNSLKAKDLIGIPWRVAFALQSDGWWLRQDIIWSKPNPMPESVTDRCTKSHEYLFLMAKSARYYWDAEAIAEPAKYPEGSWGRSKCYDGDETGKLRSFYGNGSQWEGAETRNKRSVWTVATQSYSGAHFATFPIKLIEPCILAGCPVGGVVLDPFFGSGTTGQVAANLGRRWIGIEMNETYKALQDQRLQQPGFVFTEAA